MIPVAGILSPLEDLFTEILTWFHDTIGLPWAWSIVALTVCVRFLLVPVVIRQIQEASVALLDAPWLYTYVQTGVNTWTAQHFGAIWEAASLVQTGAGYEAALSILEHQGPYRAYAAAQQQD